MAEVISLQELHAARSARRCQRPPTRAPPDLAAALRAGPAARGRRDRAPARDADAGRRARPALGAAAGPARAGAARSGAARARPRPRPAQPAGAGGRLRQGGGARRRAHGARLRLRGDRDDHGAAPARQPAPADVPPARRPRAGQPDGLQQRRRAGGRGAPGPRPRSRRRGRREHRQDEARRRTPPPTTAPARRRWRRTPTTSSSTSARPTRRGCATCRPWRSWSR